jgi:hypothetical protein
MKNILMTFERTFVSNINKQNSILIYTIEEPYAESIMNNFLEINRRINESIEANKNNFTFIGCCVCSPTTLLTIHLTKELVEKTIDKELTEMLRTLIENYKELL